MKPTLVPRTIREIVTGFTYDENEGKGLHAPCAAAPAPPPTSAPTTAALSDRTGRPRTMGNTNLAAAKAAKNDEFYTQWHDIANEMTAYRAYNEDVFKDKVILLPCDDPEWSNFTRFFAHNFERYGIKKLISTSYAQGGCGRKFVLERGVDLTGDGQIDLDDLQWEYLEGDGDFRSEEITALRDEADIVVTNPPFSLFREFMAWLIDGEVKFSVIGNMNAVTYKEIFPLIKDNKVWYGPSISSGDREFQVPDSYPLTAAGHRIGDNGEKYVRVKGVRWFTNIEHGKRYEPLQLMTMKDNLMYSRRKKIREQGYPEYDNYAAIEVAFTEAIPKDYDGVMGVPISFLDKYNPEQFEVLGISEQNLKGGSGGLWDQTSGVKHPLVRGGRKYSRIFIRHKE